MSRVQAENKMYDCVVVGAGIEGSAAAYQLAKRGQDTLLLEQFPIGHSRGSSHGHSRIIRYAYMDDHFAKMMPECFEFWMQFEKEIGEQLYRKKGLLVIDEAPYKNLDNIQGALDSIQHSYTKLTGSEIRQRYPGLGVSPSTKGIIEHDAGILMADKCLRAIQRKFQQFGGTLHDCEQVLQIIPGTTLTIITNKNRYLAKNVVLTPGPWASKMLRPLGLDPPLKSWRLNVDYWKEKKVGMYSNVPVVIVYGPDYHFYSMPSDEFPGLVKLCDHDEHEACDPDERDILTEDRVYQMKKIQGYVRQYYPELVDTPVISENCIYTFTPDQSCYLDTHPKYRNIVIACGFSGHGFKLAPVMGKIMSELVMKTKLSYDITPFKLDRFAGSTQAKL